MTQNLKWYVAFTTGGDHYYGYYGPYETKEEAEGNSARLKTYKVKHYIIQAEDSDEMRKWVWAK